MFKFKEEDVNIDGKKESLDLELHLTVNETLDIHSINLLLIFDFKIQVSTAVKYHFFFFTKYTKQFNLFKGFVSF